MSTRCVRDTDGDGDCAACARYGDSAPCRVPVEDDTRTVSLPGPVTYDDVVALMARVAEEPYRDSWGRTPSVIEEMGGYHSRPRQFMQGRGGGLPYNTNNHAHFMMRYGMNSRGVGYWVGVRTGTVEEMMVHEARENGARRSLRILSGWRAADTLDVSE